MDAGEFINQLSDILCGYREGSEQQMLSRARDLVEHERRVRLSKAAVKFTDRLDDLQQLICEVEQGWHEEADKVSSDKGE